MTGSQQETYMTVATAPPGPSTQQLSPASSSSVSSTGSTGYTGSVAPPPRPPMMPYMGWESPGGTTHFTPQHNNYQYVAESCYPIINPPNGTSAPPPPEGVPTGPPPTAVPPPCPGDNSRSGGAGQTVHFHVKQGEAVSLSLGGQVQTIQGPATVRWVSMNHHEPPMSLPVQAPPGYYVQQMVDDNGVLTHFILSENPGYPPAPPYPPGGTFNNQYAAYMGGDVNNGGLPPGPPPTNTCPTPFHQPQNFYQESNNSSSRPMKSQNHKRHKYRDPCAKPGGKPGGASSPSLSVQSTPPQSPVKPRGGNGGYVCGSRGRTRGGAGGAVDDSEESGIGIEHDEDQEEKELYIEILSNIRTPKVPEINTTWALLAWTPPACEPDSNQPARFENIKPISDTDLEYEVLISDKGKDGKYRSIYNGASLNCYLADLRPNTEYHVRVHVTLKSRNLKGGASDTVSFVTKCCEPDQPQPPKLTQRSKTSLHLRWNAPADNGRPIQHFKLELAEGGNPFAPCFEGRARQYNVSRLQPSTIYRFRLAAVNELGSSPYSEVISYATQGSPPSQPLPPTLAHTTESSLRMLWSKRPCDDEFTLQMEDPRTRGHGFLPQYNGPDVEHTLTNLRKNTTYRFKLRAHNEMGASAYSSDVSYTTDPGRPGPPPKPTLKGKVRATSFRVAWNLPADNGGSNITGYEVEVDNGGGWQSVYRGEDLEFSCDQLSPGTTYRVRVAAKSAGGISDYSETCFVTTEPVVPGAPSPPSLIDKPKACSLHLTWIPPVEDGGAPVTEYEIDMTSPDNSTRGVYRGRETECVVASLLPGRPYLFQVRAYNRAGDGPWSSPLEVISGAGPPDKPRDPKAACKSGTAVNISWDQPINNGAIITGYKLELAQVSATPELVESDTEDEEEEEEEDEELDDDVGDESEVYDDESEDEVEKAEAAPTSQPDICDKEEGGKTSEEKGSVSPIPLRDLVWRQSYSGPNRWAEVKELIPATQYQFRVCAINSAGCSPYSCNVSMETPASPPCAPHNLVLVATTSSSLTLKWKRPADNGDRINQYNIEWTGPDKETHSQPVVDRRKVSLEQHLKPDTTYTVRVQAVNTRGKGPLSPALKVSTKPLPPAPPRLECLSLLHNSLKLKWADGKGSAPLGANYILETENMKKVWYPLYNGSAHSFKHNKLAENTEFRYRIAAATEAGQGPFSTAVSFRTAFAPPPPVKLAPRVSNITESGCLLQWSSLRSGNSTSHHQQAGEQALHYKVTVSRPRDDWTTSFDAGTDLQMRIDSLDPKSDYTVRVAAIRNLPNHKPIAGTMSPAANFTTLPKSGGASASSNNSNAAAHSVNAPDSSLASRDAAWSDQKWAAVILSGFAFFAVFVAVIIQQLISLGTMSS